jgi:hypothetical protein
MTIRVEPHWQQSAKNTIKESADGTLNNKG